jgi:hypothetical protein
MSADGLPESMAGDLFTVPEPEVDGFGLWKRGGGRGGRNTAPKSQPARASVTSGRVPTAA